MVAVMCDAVFCLLIALLENFQSCLHTVCLWIWTWNQICWIIYTCLVVICYETMSLFLFCKWKVQWQVNMFDLIDLRGVVHSVGHWKITCWECFKSILYSWFAFLHSLMLMGCMMSWLFYWGCWTESILTCLCGDISWSWTMFLCLLRTIFGCNNPLMLFFSCECGAIFECGIPLMLFSIYEKLAINWTLIV